jgi:hypothetical protein
MSGRGDAENARMLPLTSRGARSFALGGLLAAAIAALPSFQWCPLPQWTAAACETSATADGPVACELATSAGEGAGCGSGGAFACEPEATPFCDRFPDPIPAGDKLWCVQPPVIAVLAKTLALDAPESAAPLAILVAPPVLDVPAVASRAAAPPALRPPNRRGSHAPPQPRAPPAG